MLNASFVFIYIISVPNLQLRNFVCLHLAIPTLTLIQYSHKINSRKRRSYEKIFINSISLPFSILTGRLY